MSSIHAAGLLSSGCGQKSRVRAGVHRTRKSSRFTGRLVSPTDKEDERRATRNQAYL
jgi:hypothetical protein